MPKTSRLLIFFCALIVLFTSTGCEALVKKFRRKPKKSQAAPELVLQPEEYKVPEVSGQERYRQYFLFWKSWTSELEEALSGKNHKKQLSCADQAIENLQGMKSLLAGQKQADLDKRIAQMTDLRKKMANDIYSMDSRLKFDVGRIKALIFKEFSYNKVEKSIVQDKRPNDS